MAKAPKTTKPAPAGEGAYTTIRALTPLDVDGVRIEEGEEAEIRAELVDALVAGGAAELVAQG